MRRPKTPRWLQRSPSVDLYRALRSPGWEVALWRDYVSSVRAWAHLAHLAHLARRERSSDPPRVLVYSWRDDVFEAKEFAMLGHAPVTQQAEPLYAVADWKFTRVIRLLRSIAPGRVEVLRPRSAQLTREDVELLTTGAYDEVLAWTADGVNLGRMVVSSAIRELMARRAARYWILSILRWQARSRLSPAISMTRQHWHPPL